MPLPRSGLIPVLACSMLTHRLVTAWPLTSWNQSARRLQLLCWTGLPANRSGGIGFSSSVMAIVAWWDHSLSDFPKPHPHGAMLVAPFAEWVARTLSSTISKPDRQIDPATRLTQRHRREAKVGNVSHTHQTRSSTAGYLSHLRGTHCAWPKLLRVLRHYCL